MTGEPVAPVSDHIVGDAAILPALREGAVHRLDDVAAHAEVAECPLGFKAYHPFARTGRGGEAHLLQMLDSADDQATAFGIGGAGRLRAQVDVPGLVGGNADLYIEPRPALGGNFLPQGVADFVLRSWPEFDRDELLGTRAQATADVVARDTRSAPVSSTPRTRRWTCGLSVFQ